MGADVQVFFEARIEEGRSLTFGVDLFDEIVTEESTSNVFATKVEIKMKKQKAFQWRLFEASAEQSRIREAPAESQAQAKAAKPPQIYRKNWDAIAKEIPEEKLEGDAALNKVFQDIFSNGSEEQKRAMMKSFVESGGTVLSTNWDEVGKGKVQGSPPDGLEMRDWQSHNKIATKKELDPFGHKEEN